MDRQLEGSSGEGTFVAIAGGHRLFVRDWGSGHPVVLLAGWAMDSRCWGEVMLALNAAGLRTIAYDRRGHGQSSDPGRADYDLLADDLAAVLETLDLGDVILVGHSGAGGEAIRYLSRYGSARVAHLVLVGATGPVTLAGPDNPVGPTAEMVDGLVAWLSQDLGGWIDANIAAFAPGANPRTLDWLAGLMFDCSRRVMIDFQRAIAHADFRAEAAALRVPVTIVHGDADASAPIDLTARRYARIVPDARLLVYDGVAHGVMVTHAQRLAGDIAALAT